MAKTIVFANNKGGTAKTTTCLAFASGLTKRGYKVLCIDTDPQAGNLSYALSADKDSVQGTYEAFTSRRGMTRAAEYIQQTPTCACIAANYDLTMIDGLLSGAPDRNERLSPVVQEVSQAYDYILIDTPPTFGALTANALTAADEIIIPTGADSTAMAGIVEVINQAKQAGLDVAGVLITCFRANTKLQRECESAIRGIMAELGVRVYNAKIRQSVVVQTAQRNRAALFDFDESAPVAQDYEQFIDEYLNPVQE